MADWTDETTIRARLFAPMRGPITAAAACMALLGLAGCERWTLDRQMEELCKKDGGVKVYERVTLPASEFNDLGTPLYRYYKPGVLPDDRLGPEYRYVTRREILVGEHADPAYGQGQLARHYWAIYRRADGKLLGEQVQYERIGGDRFTFGFQPSSKVCPTLEGGFDSQVFMKGD